MDAGGSKGGMKADINVTPLVDIVLVLLIIFIVITPAVNSSVKLPTAKHSPKAEKNKDEKYLTLLFQSKRNDKYEVIGPGPILIDDREAKDERFSIGDEAQQQKLADYINRNVSQLSQRVVFVKADADLPFKYINELFQVCRKGGADEASIVTSEDKEKEGGK